MQQAKKMQPAFAGGKFLNETDRAELTKERRREVRKAEREETRKARAKVITVITGVICDALLMYMVLNGLIHQLYGVLFVAAASAIIGYNFK